jgi:SOS-response transcriptional repressor LexA
MRKLKHSLKFASRHCLIKKDEEIIYPKAMLKKTPSKKPPTQEQIELGKRVKEAVLSLGHGGQTEIAKACNIEPQSVNGWFRTGRIGTENLLIVADITHYNLHWLVTGTGPKRELDKIKHNQSIKINFTGDRIAEPNIAPGPEIKGKIPLINYVQAGHWAEIMESHEPMEWIARTIEVSQKAFALRIKGDSMTNPFGAPSLPEGFIAIVEPEAPYEHGSIVVARLENSNEATIKQLVIDGPHRYLKPLNPNYRTIEINENCVICGVVKRAQFDL